MSIAQDLDELKTSVWGYDRESVHHLFNEYLQEQEELRKKEMETLLNQNHQYQVDLKETQEKLKDARAQYDKLAEQFNKVVNALTEGRKFSAERDQKLEEYYQKKDDIDRIADRVRKEAEEKSQSLILDAKKQANEMIQKARADADAMMQNARESSQMICSEQREKSEEIWNAMKDLQENLIPAFEWLEQIRQRGLFQPEIEPAAEPEAEPTVDEKLPEEDESTMETEASKVEETLISNEDQTVEEAETRNEIPKELPKELPKKKEIFIDKEEGAFQFVDMDMDLDEDINATAEVEEDTE